MRIVVMGPSGSGKSLVGAALAARLRARFVDGDDLHPRANVDKMRSAEPLSDADREPWLDTVASVLVRDAPVVVACSALRRRYRDRIRRTCADAWFVELVVPAADLRTRMARRRHFMPESLLPSQLDTLEPLSTDEAGMRIDGTIDLEGIAGQVTAVWQARAQ